MSTKYGTCVFAHVENRNVFNNRNGKSCVALNVTVPIPALGLVLETAIWGRLKESAEGHEVTFEAALPRGLKGLRDDMTGRDELLGHIETQAAAWTGYQAATAASYATLTGVKPQSAAVARPKLVYKPDAKPDAGQQTTSQPTSPQGGTLVGKPAEGKPTGATKA